MNVHVSRVQKNNFEWSNNVIFQGGLTNFLVSRVPCRVQKNQLLGCLIRLVGARYLLDVIG